MPPRSAVAAVVCLVAAAASAGAADAYVREIERWREERVAKLTAADGWLTLVGLHFLREGANTVGSAPDNTIVLQKAPPRLGTISVAGGNVTLQVAAPGAVQVDGKPVASAALDWNEKAPTLVTFGTITCFVVDRNGRKALRVRDTEAEARRKFAGLDYFPIDPAWRIVARWVPFERARVLTVPTSAGPALPTVLPGKAVFEREGRTFELLAIDEGLGLPLFFVFADATSGRETYGGMRFLYASAGPDGTIVLDFNRAYNPPCVFTPYATCPLPPPGNKLPFAVRAGEKTYQGGHD